ncbi:hypothetical protein DFJ74DRAFT_756610 [Hyaloraphidium curvatum]|nr:hypothetical protein DFJ74DRAFT_756610 [Hyaloraphidium curvatum]
MRGPAWAGALPAVVALLLLPLYLFPPGDSPAALRPRPPPPPPAPWDASGLGASRSRALAHRGSLCRLRRAMRTAAAAGRPLRVGVLGGSFSAGAGVPDASLAFPGVLQKLLRERPGTIAAAYGADVVSLAQGASDYTLPMLCLENIHALVTADGEMPDVWVAEFQENMALDVPGERFGLDAGKYASFLDTLLRAPGRSRNGTAAVVLAGAVFQPCLGQVPQREGARCRWRTLFPVQLAAARKLDLPLVSWLHGVAAALPGSPDPTDPAVVEGFPNATGRTLELLREWSKQLFAYAGDPHFGVFGHNLFGDYIWDAFRLASEDEAGAECGDLGEWLDEEDVAVEIDATERPPPPSRAPSNATAAPPPAPRCNLTLTHTHSPSLGPLSSHAFPLREYRETNGFGTARTDTKRTYTPASDDAWIAFDVDAVGAGELCVLAYGASGALLGEFAGTRCEFAPRALGAPLYTMVCNCTLPAGAGRGVLNLTSGEGVQVAGVAVY